MKRTREGYFKGPKLPHDLLDQMDGGGGDPSSQLGRQARFPDRNPKEQRRPGSVFDRRKELRKAKTAPKPADSARPKQRPQRPTPKHRSSEHGTKATKEPASGSEVWEALKKAKQSKTTENNTEHRQEEKKRKTSRPSTVRKEEEEGGDDQDIQMDGQASGDLDAFDAEIASLEKKLGGSKTASKAIDDDGFGFLLADIGGKASKETRRKRALRELKSSNKAPVLKPGTDVLESDSDVEDDSDGHFLEQDTDSDETQDDDEDDDEGSGNEDSGEDDIDWDGEDSDSEDGTEDDETMDEPEEKKVRQNPYMPAVAPDELAVTTRTEFAEIDDESSRQLQKQIQGQVNKLSEPSMVAISRAVGELYKTNSRHATSSTIVKLLIAAIATESAMLDSFLILHAGFAAAMIRIAGVDLCAMLIDQVVKGITQGLDGAAGSTKRALNLVSFLCFLFAFGVAGPTVVFDYLKRFLVDLGETNTEFVLRIVRCCGQQLRHEDPSALLDIVVIMQTQAAKAGVDGMSVRTRFMIETINDLKNNKLREARASTMAAEQMTRLKKTVGLIGKQPEPLNIGLTDLEDADKRGKWWIVGASWKGLGGASSGDAAEGPEQPQSVPPQSTRDSAATAKSRDGLPAIKGALDEDGLGPDVDTIARSLGINNPVRKAIFRTIVGSANCDDAFPRLLRLRLSKKQQLEIPRVVVQAAVAEQLPNPYYSRLARMLCAHDVRWKKGFGYVMWDYWSRMRVYGSVGRPEGEAMDDEDDAGSDRAVSVNEIVNLGMLFGHLVATETQEMAKVLKPVLEGTVLDGNAPVLLHPPKPARSFLRVFFYAFFIDSMSSHRWTPSRKVTAVDPDESADLWDRPFAGPQQATTQSRQFRRPEDVVVHLAGRLAETNPDSCGALLVFCRKNIRIRPDGTGGIANLAHKKRDVKKIQSGWPVMQQILERATTGQDE